jgi:signal transduction histidine kinase
LRLIDPRFILTIMAAAMTLVLDSVTPLGFAIWLAQVVLVWVASLWANARQIIAVWVVCSLSIVLGFWFSAKTGLVMWVEISNIALGLAATAAITKTCLRHKTAESARRKAQEAALRAEAVLHYREMKRTLLESISHTVQTPLTSIRAGIDAIRTDHTNPDQQEWLTIMGDESVRLSSGVADAIHLARIEADSTDLDKHPHTIDELVDSLLEREDAQIANLEVDLPLGLPAVDADVGLVQMAIRNVIANARRYSPPDTPIRLCAQAERDHVIVSIVDRGHSISQAEQTRILNARDLGSRGIVDPTGLGMGLATARQVIEAHGGRMWIQSRHGDGTTVSFTLPSAFVG